MRLQDKDMNIYFSRVMLQSGGADVGRLNIWLIRGTK
jgi:hypothetical protein